MRKGIKDPVCRGHENQKFQMILKELHVEILTVIDSVYKLIPVNSIHCAVSVRKMNSQIIPENLFFTPHVQTIFYF